MSTSLRPRRTLVTIDLSGSDQPGGKEELVRKLDHFVKNEEVDRQFALGREFYALPLKEKLKYHSARLGNGIKDNIQVYKIPKFDGHHARSHPPILTAHIKEIEAFSSKSHTEVLVRGHQYDVEGEDHLRYMHYAARGAEENKRAAEIHTPGHTDLGSVTLLFRQPIAALQILNNEGQWKWVKPQDGTITINTCDALTALTGGLIKSSIHRVRTPPADQAGIDRLGVLYFARPNNHVVLDPIPNIPVLQRLGLTSNVFTELGKHLTMKGWVKVRQTQQQRWRQEAQISEDGKYTYKPKDLEIMPVLLAKVYN
ncbi:iron/ascorbate family oxidoreductase [Aspergillus falconensis]